MALVAGCGAIESAPHSPSQHSKVVMPADPYRVSPANTAYIESQFNKYSDHLKAVGAIATNTTLVLLNDGDRFTCVEPGSNRPHVLGSHSLSEYCPSADAVVLTAGGMNAAVTLGAGQAEITFTIGHELGHARQNKDGELTSAALEMPEHPHIEDQASCYGGIEVGQFDASYVPVIDNLLLRTPMFSDHGTSQSEADAFMNGAKRGVCDLGHTPTPPPAGS